MFYPRSDSKQRKESPKKVHASDRRVPVASVLTKINTSSRNFAKRHVESTISSKAKQLLRKDQIGSKRPLSRNSSQQRAEKDSEHDAHVIEKMKEPKIVISKPNFSEKKVEHENPVQTEQVKCPSIIICDDDSVGKLEVSQNLEDGADFQVIDREDILKSQSFIKANSDWNDSEESSIHEFSSNINVYSIKEDTISNLSKNDFGIESEIFKKNELIDQKICDKEKELDQINQTILSKIEEAGILEEAYNSKLTKFDEEYNNKVETSNVNLVTLKEKTNYIDTEIKKNNKMLSDRKDELKA